MPLRFGEVLSVAELRRRVGRLEQIAGVTSITLETGRAKGVRALEIRNLDGLRALLVVDRAMDMLSLEWRGVPLAWQSQNGVTAPEYYNSEGDAFLRPFFGGMLTTCGLANFGPASDDRYGRVGLHGSINHTPAENYSFEVSEHNDSLCFEVRASMRQSGVLAENLRLNRIWQFPLDGRIIRLRDCVTNGDRPWPHMMLYHCNAGYPLLSEDLRIYLSHSGMRPRDAAAQHAIKEWDRGGCPQADFQEQVFVHQMQATNDKWVVGLFDT